MKKLVFTVTNNLIFDQRMIRICTSLQQAGYEVLLVGRSEKNSPPLALQPFNQTRLRCRINKGPLFYLEYNLKLFFFLLTQRLDCICAIDLDTILPAYFVTVLRRKRRVYDAHELFCEMKEVVTRPLIYKVWKSIERFAVPRFKNGYTVNRPIQEIFFQSYGVRYAVVRNIAVLQPVLQVAKQAFITYQGAVNEGHCFETLIPAFKHISVPLHIYGDGNFLEPARALIKKHSLQEKVLLKGKVVPAQLKNITPAALLGITLFENAGLSNYYSLANRFFDYVHAGIPQICVNFPVYEALNREYEVAVLVEDTTSEHLSAVINKTLCDEALLTRLSNNCVAAQQRWNWQQEAQTLIQFYKKLFV